MQLETNSDRRQVNDAINFKEFTNLPDYSRGAAPSISREPIYLVPTIALMNKTGNEEARTLEMDYLYILKRPN